MKKPYGGRKRPWPNLRYFADYCVKDLGESRKLYRIDDVPAEIRNSYRISTNQKY
jgi:hypothetical protein